jgi:hypothetical protein
VTAALAAGELLGHGTAVRQGIIKRLIQEVHWRLERRKSNQHGEDE